jgi:hypothetical protein
MTPKLSESFKKNTDTFLHYGSIRNDPAADVSFYSKKELVHFK